MAIKIAADKTLYYNFCYQTQCAAKYGPNPDLKDDKVDEKCKNMCIGNSKKRTGISDS
jgi:hypothetical protein